MRLPISATVTTTTIKTAAEATTIETMWEDTMRQSHRSLPSPSLPNTGKFVSSASPAPHQNLPLLHQCTFHETVSCPYRDNSRNSPSASRINTAKLSDGALRILRTCKYRQQLFATALQHFDLHFQFFDSSLNGDRFQRYAEIEPTMHAALRAGNELVPPHKHFSDAVKQYRIFLAMELLVYLDPQGSVTREIAKKFNELSEEYGDKESKIRTAMGVMYHRTSGGGKKMIDEYVDMFKQRQKLLQSQFMELKALVERTLTEINKIA